jgi:cytoskeletal protein CcmA (bactofilin family)
MAKDFRASQIETSKLILTGGIASSTIGAAIYSGSVATNREGGIPATMLNDVGSDVFLFVSGTKSNNDFTRSDVTLFGGDIVVSGTLYAERQVIEVDGQVDGDLIVTGNFYVKPDANSTKSVEFRNAANQSMVTVDTSNKKVSIFSGDGSGAADVAFYVSGSVGSKGTTDERGAALFDGDLITSGALYVHGTSDLPGTTVSAAIVLDSNPESAIVWDSSVDSNYPDAMIYETSGDLYVSASEKVLIQGSESVRVIANGEKDYLRFDSINSQAVSQFNILNDDIDFRIGNQTHDQAVWIDAVEETVNIDRKITEAIPGSDINFYVSGAIGSKGTNERKASLFGGDLITSGTLYVHGTKDLPGTSVSSAIVLDSGTESAIVWDSSVDSNYPDAALYENGGVLYVTASSTVHLQGGPLGVYIGESGTGGVFARFLDNSGQLENIFNPLGADIDFTVETDNKNHAIFVDASTDQVLILSGGAAASPDESSAPDVNFFVSGSKGAHGGSTKGTAVFGGDTFISGSAYVSTLFVEEEDPTIIFREPGTVTDKATIGINSSDNIQIENKTTNKHIVFKVNDGGVVREGFRIDGGIAEVVVNQGAEALVDFRVESDNKTHAIFVDGSADKVLILSGGAPASFDEAAPSDVAFYVSGSVNSSGTVVKGTAVFGGDQVISGSSITKSGVRRSIAFKNSNFNVAPDNHFLFINTNSGHVTASLESAAAAGEGRVLTFKDVKGFADSNYIVIKPNGSDKIEGINDETKIKVASGSLSLVSDGDNNYFIYGERD